MQKILVYLFCNRLWREHVKWCVVTAVPPEPQYKTSFSVTVGLNPWTELIKQSSFASVLSLQCCLLVPACPQVHTKNHPHSGPYGSMLTFGRTLTLQTGVINCIEESLLCGCGHTLTPTRLSKIFSISLILITYYNNLLNLSPPNEHLLQSIYRLSYAKEPHTLLIYGKLSLQCIKMFDSKHHCKKYTNSY